MYELSVMFVVNIGYDVLIGHLISENVVNIGYDVLIGCSLSMSTSIVLERTSYPMFTTFSENRLSLWTKL
jgi:hypothetical protein